MRCQKSKFNLDTDVTYLNCANLAPLMNHSALEGKSAIDRRQKPYLINRKDWFEPVTELKKNFARLIHCDNYDRVVPIPSVSYGIATAAKNIVLEKDDEILLAGDQYPSNYYSWVDLAKRSSAKVIVVAPPSDLKHRGRIWNELILQSITKRTKIVAISHVHWTDGTLFNLKDIGAKARANRALFIIDGSQSIGALPIYVEHLKPDAVFTVGYKWLLGPFSLGLAYYGEFFDNGSPLEENWINRKESEKFEKLTEYTCEYGSGADRYAMGQKSSFHLVPILNGALEQLNEWGVENVQSYCKNLVSAPIDELRRMGCHVEQEDFRANHLFGVRFPNSIDMGKLHHQLLKHQIFVSIRGSALRVAVNVYNDYRDLEKLVGCIGEVIRT